MALKIHKKKKIGGTTFLSGHMYKFNYQAYQNDPEPSALMINILSGYHPKTGHEHHYIQCINLSYIPRKDRKKFVDIWQREMDKNKNIEITWKKIKAQYPYIQEGIRRYLYKPRYYIRRIQWIPPQEWQSEVVRSWHKDFSQQIRKKIASKLKRFFVGPRGR